MSKIAGDISREMMKNKSKPFNPYWLQPGAAVPVDIETTAALLAELKAMLQAISDPENQPSQFGTVTLEHMEREIAAEREQIAQLVETMGMQGYGTLAIAAAIRKGNP